MNTMILESPFAAPRLMASEDYLRLSRLIHSLSGIKMPPSKKTFLEGRLRKRLHHLGYATFDEYCRYVFDQGGLAEEQVALIDAVTTNKTDFFREPHHFDYLGRECLPRLAERGLGIHQPLRIWSAGCSIGAEPYTIAMVCQDFAAQVAGFRFEILGSDISVSVLKQAVRAIYSHAVIEPVPMDLRKRYLMRDDSRDEVRITQKLRKTVSFSRINLIDPDDRPRHPMDLVFCRNLLIYFDKPTQRSVVRRLCQNLRPGGYLFLGHSESITGFDLPLHPVTTTVFLRGDD